MALDQAPGDRGPGAVELGGAVAGFTDQHHPSVGEAFECIGEARAIQSGQRFGVLAQQAHQMLFGRFGNA